MQWKELDPGVSGEVAALSCQRQDKYSYHNGQQRESSNQNSLTHRDMQRWLVDHSAPVNDIDGQPTKFLLDLYKQKSSRSREQKSNLNQKNKKSHLLHQFPDLRQFTDLEPLE